MLQNAKSDVPIPHYYIFIAFFFKIIINALEHVVIHTSVFGLSDFNIVGFDCEYHYAGLLFPEKNEVIAFSNYEGKTGTK